MSKVKLYAKIVAAFFLTFSMTVAPFFAQLRPGGKNAYFEDWSAEQTFTADYAVRLDKEPGKDFVILNLTDIQMKDDETFDRVGAQAKATIDKLVEDTHPDLITVTGDNAWQMLSYNEMIRTIDSYGIPWAPVMGNHDGQGCPSEFWCAYNFYKAKNCLFRFGPKDMGYGNYIIHIYENDQIVHTLFMMDTHSNIDADNCNGKKGEGYDHLWENQMEWYKWAVAGTEKLAGKPVESTVYFHIPLVEYVDAWKMATGDGKSGSTIKPEYADTCFGDKGEGECCPPENNGFFDLMLRLGSTKNVVVGHDHVNSYSVLYRGIRLTYGLKTGEACYWEPGRSGGTTVTVGANGSAAVAHHYVDTASMPY